MRNLITLSLLLFTFSLQAQMSANQLLLIEEAPVYSAPAFPGGEAELLGYIASKLDYPELAQEYNVEGMVVARLQLNPSGEVQSTTIVKSLGFGCDEAVLEVIDSMPRWQPARYGDQAEYSVVYLPVRFSLR
ncbi:MAG: energy transducer TonB [Bacteroidota bacterium]